MANSPNVGYIRPEVVLESPKWQMVDDCVAGEMDIKSKGELYLPVPEVNTDPAKNSKSYQKLIQRAVFYPVTGRTLEGLVGQVFSKPVTYDVPDSLEPMMNDIDGAGTSLEQQSKASLSEALKKGRGGLLSDFPEVPEGAVVSQADIDAGMYRPRIIQYDAEQIINWREETTGGETMLSLLVIQELAIEDVDGFELEVEPRWRVYKLEDSQVIYQSWKLASENQDIDPLVAAEMLRSGDHGSEYLNQSQEYEQIGEDVILMGADGNPLSVIPFTFFGSTNNDPSVDKSPMYALASLNIAHYRNSADYEQSAFMVGQVTPVISGLTDDWVQKHIKGQVMVGSSNAVALPKDGKFELIQAQPNSMPMEAMVHKEEQMKAIGAKLIEPNTVAKTATEAEIEEVSESSILSSVAKNVSEAYERALYYASLFIGEVDMDDISIEMNSEFQVAALGAQERQEVVNAWMAGIITKREAREVYRRKGIATLGDDEAFEAIASEGVPEM